VGTADYALIVSLFSLTIAAASFIWNVWSKFIFPKPKVVVSVGVFSMHSGGQVSHPHLALSFSNYGPGEVTIHLSCVERKRFPWSRADQGMINPINNFPMQPYTSLGPFSGGLPKKLLVGEAHTLRFPYEARSFLALPLTRIGGTDTFGRHHWATGKQLRHVRKQFAETFPGAARAWGDPMNDEEEPR
jgi:hypothetical protein